MGAADVSVTCGQAPGGEAGLGGPAGRPTGLIIRPMEECDLAGAAAIEATAPDAWSENALRGSLQAQREGGAARLFVAEWCGAVDGHGRYNPELTELSAAVRGSTEAGPDKPLAGAAGGETASARTTTGPTLAGVAAFQCAGGAASLDTLTVAPDFRRQGVARTLLQTALAQLCAEGAVFCFLEVRESNAPAIALYKSLGFAAAGRRRNFYRAPAEDALVMRCVLPL